MGSIYVRNVYIHIYTACVYIHHVYIHIYRAYICIYIYKHIYLCTYMQYMCIRRLSVLAGGIGAVVDLDFLPLAPGHTSTDLDLLLIRRDGNDSSFLRTMTRANEFLMF